MIHVCERGIIICSNKMGMMMNIVMIIAIRRLHHSGKKERERVAATGARRDCLLDADADVIYNIFFSPI